MKSITFKSSKKKLLLDFQNLNDLNHEDEQKNIGVLRK